MDHRIDLWDAFDDLRREFERSWGGPELADVSGLLDWPTGPAIDLVEGEDELLLLADLPGVRKEDLELNVQGKLLTIKGEKKRDEPTKSRKVVKTESWVGAFNRTVELPDGVDPNKVEAQLRDGVLRIRIAKREESKKRTIRVSVK